MDASDAPPHAGPPLTRKLTTDRLTCDGGRASGRRPADPCSGIGVGDWPGRRPLSLVRLQLILYRSGWACIERHNPGPTQAWMASSPHASFWLRSDRVLILDVDQRIA